MVLCFSNINDYYNCIYKKSSALLHKHLCHFEKKMSLQNFWKSSTVVRSHFFLFIWTRLIFCLCTFLLISSSVPHIQAASCLYLHSPGKSDDPHVHPIFFWFILFQDVVRSHSVTCSTMILLHETCMSRESGAMKFCPNSKCEPSLHPAHSILTVHSPCSYDGAYEHHHELIFKESEHTVVLWM